MIKHPKRRGEWAELQFMLRAASLGLNVCKPWGDSARFDFAVEHPGGCHRVQVKSTASVNKPGGLYVCSLPRWQAYSLGEFDFLAVYIIPKEIWYIIPAAVVCLRKRAFLLNPHCPESKYHPYLEAWHLLSGRPAADLVSSSTLPAAKTPHPLDHV